MFSCVANEIIIYALITASGADENENVVDCSLLKESAEEEGEGGEEPASASRRFSD